MVSIIPKISVIVPVYKAEKYVHKCVDSILAQTFTDFELLLVDDGSPDRSGEICDEYAAKDSRIKVFHKENGGVSSARNLGINKAIANWITFIDADDFIAPSFLENLYHPIEKDNKIDFVHAGCLNYYNGTISVNQSYTEKIDNDPTFLANNLRGLPFSKLFNKNTLYTHLIKFDERVEIAEDMIFTFDYIQYINQYAFLPEEGYFYRKDNNFSATKCGKIRSYTTSYYGFEHLYQSIEKFIVLKSVPRKQIACRYEQLGATLFSVLSSLYLNKITRKERIEHLHTDFKFIDSSTLSDKQLPIIKKILFNIFKNQHYKLFDLLMSTIYIIKGKIK